MSEFSFTTYQAKVHSTKSARMAVDRIYRLERSLSVRVSYYILKLLPRIRPTTVSIANVMLVLVALGLNFLKTPVDPFGLAILQLVLLKAATIGDRIDGEIARFKEYFTQKGIYFDLAFHFLYPFVFIFSIGYSFSLYFGGVGILLLSVVVALLMTYYKMFGKLRHHIKYKVEFESHSGVLRDYQDQKAETISYPKIFRFVNYLLFFIYDWVWLAYLILIIGVMLGVDSLSTLYLGHLILVGVAVVWQVFVVYPRRSLFSRDDFTQSRA